MPRFAQIENKQNRIRWTVSRYELSVRIKLSELFISTINKLKHEEKKQAISFIKPFRLLEGTCDSGTGPKDV